MSVKLKQVGGGACSLCGAPNTSKATCPLNPGAKNTVPSKHNVQGNVRSSPVVARAASPRPSPVVARAASPRPSPVVARAASPRPSPVVARPPPATRSIAIPSAVQPELNNELVYSFISLCTGTDRCENGKINTIMQTGKITYKGIEYELPDINPFTVLLNSDVMSRIRKDTGYKKRAFPPKDFYIPSSRVSSLEAIANMLDADTLDSGYIKAISKCLEHYIDKTEIVFLGCAQGLLAQMLWVPLPERLRFFWFGAGKQSQAISNFVKPLERLKKWSFFNIVIKLHIFKKQINPLPYSPNINNVYAMTYAGDVLGGNEELQTLIEAIILQDVFNLKPSNIYLQMRKTRNPAVKGPSFKERAFKSLGDEGVKANYFSTAIYEQGMIRPLPRGAYALPANLGGVSMDDELVLTRELAYKGNELYIAKVMLYLVIAQYKKGVSDTLEIWSDPSATGKDLEKHKEYLRYMEYVSYVFYHLRVILEHKLERKKPISIESIRKDYEDDYKRGGYSMASKWRIK